MKSQKYHLRFAGAATLSTWQKLQKLTGTNPKRGADFASPLQQHQLLQPPHQGFLLDGHHAALSLKDSYKNTVSLGTVL